MAQTFIFTKSFSNLDAVLLSRYLVICFLPFGVDEGRLPWRVSERLGFLWVSL